MPAPRADGLPFLNTRSFHVTLLLGFNFLAFGASLTYLGRWLQAERGLSGFEIAMVLSAAQLARLAIGPMVAAWADSRSDRRTPLLVLSTVTALGFALMFQAHGLWMLLALAFIAQSATHALSPLAERVMIRDSLDGQGLPYGVLRGIASFSFVVGAVAGGFLIEAKGIQALAWWVTLALGAGAATAWIVLKPDPVVGGKSRWLARLVEGLALFRRPALAVPIAAATFVQCSHAFYYAFSAIVWTENGVPEGLIGLLWACGTGVEIMFLLSLRRNGLFSPEAFIALGAVGAIVRWTAFAVTPSFELLWPLQALHALTFAAAHVGALRLVQRESPEAVAGVAQTIYAAVSQGTFMGLATFASGALYDRVGVAGYFAMSALGVVGFALACLSMVLAGRRAPAATPAR